MVIASGADLIFLDEPTTGLDPISRKELWEILIDLSKDRFLFITTHYLEEAERVADRIGILDDGRLLVLGSMEELRAKLPHQYCLRVSAGADLPTFEGEKRLGRDGQVQVLTSQEEAMHISRSLLERKEKFSLNPVTLDDIFYQMVGRTISSEVEEEDLK